MDISHALRDARRSAGISQSELARLTRTSQATISAYENGVKEPSVATLGRLLAALGAQLAVVPGPAAVIPPSPRELARSGRRLAQVIELAEALPHRFDPELEVPRRRALEGQIK
jgi:transcriptional regulator with XRE-family HTH domain